MEKDEPYLCFLADANNKTIKNLKQNMKYPWEYPENWSHILFVYTWHCHKILDKNRLN